MKAVIFDIDGTLANISQRLHFIQKTPKDWKGFYCLMRLDQPIEPLCWLLGVLFERRKEVVECGNGQLFEIFFVTGRPEKYRDETANWIMDNIPFAYDFTLKMRKDKDHRSDFEIKEEFLKELQARGYQILFAVEDRQQCVDMYRRNGVMCLQCAEGNF